jgi:hypothetical protein
MYSQLLLTWGNAPNYLTLGQVVHTRHCSPLNKLTRIKTVSIQLTNFITRNSIFLCDHLFVHHACSNYQYVVSSLLKRRPLRSCSLISSKLWWFIEILLQTILALYFFHLLTHALFKALLFMCARGGGVFYSIGDSQDIRFIGGLSIYIPLLFNILHQNVCWNFPQSSLIKICFPCNLPEFKLNLQY